MFAMGKVYQLFGDLLGTVLDENRTTSWLCEHKMLILALNPVL
jgi:hypothetical protein